MTCGNVENPNTNRSIVRTWSCGVPVHKGDLMGWIGRVAAMTLIVFVIACSDGASPDAKPVSIGGAWTISDTFGLAGTIMLQDADPTAYSGNLDTLSRWVQEYGDTLAIDAFALGNGTISVGRSTRSATECGAMAWREWDSYSRSAADTAAKIRFQCGGVVLLANLPSRIRGGATSFSTTLASAPIPGLADTTSPGCEPNIYVPPSACETKLVGAAVTLTRSP